MAEFHPELFASMAAAEHARRRAGDILGRLDKDILPQCPVGFSLAQCAEPDRRADARPDVVLMMEGD